MFRRLLQKVGQRLFDQVRACESQRYTLGSAHALVSEKASRPSSSRFEPIGGNPAMRPLIGLWDELDRRRGPYCGTSPAAGPSSASQPLHALLPGRARAMKPHIRICTYMCAYITISNVLMKIHFSYILMRGYIHSHICIYAYIYIYTYLTLQDKGDEDAFTISNLLMKMHASKGVASF